MYSRDFRELVKGTDMMIIITVTLNMRGTSVWGITAVIPECGTGSRKWKHDIESNWVKKPETEIWDDVMYK